MNLFSPAKDKNRPAVQLHGADDVVKYGGGKLSTERFLSPQQQDETDKRVRELQLVRDKAIHAAGIIRDKAVEAASKEYSAAKGQAEVTYTIELRAALAKLNGDGGSTGIISIAPAATAKVAEVANAPA